MATDPTIHSSLSDVAARQLANATKTIPQVSSITPRWLVHCLQWIPVEAGIYRRNRVKDEASVSVDCSGRDERKLPETFVDYVWGSETSFHFLSVDCIVSSRDRSPSG